MEGINYDLDPLVGAAMAGGVIQTAGGILGNIGAKKRATHQHNLNMEAWEQANDWNIEQWHRENAYNDPRKQMERLSAAGLNPNLVYGGGSLTQQSGSINSTAPPRAEQPNWKNPFQGVANVMSDALLKKSQVDLLQAQSETQTMEALLKEQQRIESQTRVDESKRRTDKMILDYDIAQELRAGNLEAQKLNNDLTVDRLLTTKLEREGKSQQMIENMVRLYWDVRLAKATLTGKDLDNDLKRYAKELRDMGINENDPWFVKILAEQGQKIREIPGYGKEMLENAKNLGTKLVNQLPKWLQP